ncbi:hypothetical protein [Bdellovibrio sp.]|uniref:hypothetical protein n=1 Tax=Bdellovibrio sp. TaxID=28201 RepID=UPI0039E2BCB5
MIITPWQLSETALWTGYGKHLWSDWHFLYQDTASVLPTDNNVTSAWLLSLIYYGAYRLGDLFAVAHLHHLVLLALLGVVYSKTIFKNAWPWTLGERATIYLMWLGSGAYFSPRPALLAFLPFVFSYLILDKRSSSKETLTWRDWRALILLQILWVNVHGSFVLLPLMAGWVLLFQRPRFQGQNLAGFVGLLLATLINPFGFQIYPYVFKTKEFSELLGISEWISVLSWEYPTQLICYWLLFWGMIYLVFFSRPKNSNLLRSAFTPLLLLPLLGGLRLSVFAFFALPIFLSHWTTLYAQRPAQKTSSSPWAALAALGVITFIMIRFSPYFKETHRFDEASIFGITNYIEDSKQAQCPILNDLNLGHFLLLKTTNPLLMDGRITPYTKKALSTYLSFMNGTQTDSLISTTAPCFVILSQSRSSNLIGKMQTEYRFKTVFSENGYVLLQRQSP